MARGLNTNAAKQKSRFRSARLSSAARYSENVHRRTGIIATALVIAGLFAIEAEAQSPPPPNAAYGTYPHDYKEIITKWLDAQLVDPNSVVIKWLSEPRPGELTVSKGKTVSGFMVDFSTNARNIFGAYTGAQKHTALIRDGQLVTATGFVGH